jgi:hypothetical protein
VEGHSQQARRGRRLVARDFDRLKFWQLELGSDLQSLPLSGRVAARTGAGTWRSNIA